MVFLCASDTFRYSIFPFIDLCTLGQYGTRCIDCKPESIPGFQHLYGGLVSKGRSTAFRSEAPPPRRKNGLRYPSVLRKIGAKIGA